MEQLATRRKTSREQTAHVQVQPAPAAVGAAGGWEEADAQPGSVAGSSMTTVNWGEITPDRVCKNAEDWGNKAACKTVLEAQPIEPCQAAVAETAQGGTGAKAKAATAEAEPADAELEEAETAVAEPSANAEPGLAEQTLSRD